MKHHQSRTWVWNFDSPIQQIWTSLADTARFNEAAELPRHDIEESVGEDGAVTFLARAKMGPMSLVWDDHPANWVADRWFRHERQFRNGPFKSVAATLRFFPTDEGCRGEYTLEAEAANLLGRWALKSRFFNGSERAFAKLAANARDYALGQRSEPFDHKPPSLPTAALVRADEAVKRIDAGPYGHGLAGRLAEYVLQRQEVDVWTIRPLKLARLWNVPERHAIEVCLAAVKEGLLRLRWDLLCPRCRVGKDTVQAMDQLPRGAHCSSCNIDFERNFSSNVEAAFQPANEIRPLESGEYCLYGPMSTPHVKAQITLQPGEIREEPVDFVHGIYRIRTLEPGGESLVEFDSENTFPTVIVDGSTVSPGPPGPDGILSMENQHSRPRTVVVEEREWTRDALTAHRATSLQVFRDLFNSEMLRTGDDVEIDRVTLMFTDLRGSTALYDRIGDSNAYVLVRRHYAVIGRAVRECDGAVVKTIGDAVMAAFVNPADALRCCIRIQDDFAKINDEDGAEPFVIKLGLHSGPCISVTLNNRLDYYGSAANMAARLQDQSQGGDLVISVATALDPDVSSLLGPFGPMMEQADLKGFSEPVMFYRVSPENMTRGRTKRQADQEMAEDSNATPGTTPSVAG